MQIFLDTANVEEIAEGLASGRISGVTTNPSIIAREGKPFSRCIEGIVALNDGLTILVEVTATEKNQMVIEAGEFSRMAKNVVVKIPVTSEGLGAVSILKDEGVRTAVTLVFSAN